MDQKRLSKLYIVLVGLVCLGLVLLLTGPARGETAPDGGGAVMVPAWVAASPDASLASDAGSAGVGPVVIDPNSPDIVSKLVGLVAKLAAGSEWGLLAAVGIMLIVNLLWRIKAIKERLPRSALPWVSVGIGALTGFVVSWASGVTWWKALLNYTVYALAASGLYSAGGKKILRQ